MIFPWQRALRTDPKEDNAPIVTYGQLPGNGPKKKKHITPLLARCLSNVPKKNWPKRKHHFCLAKGDAYEY
jgi:hypothetical protein